jgi:hypothetical protein
MRATRRLPPTPDTLPAPQQRKKLEMRKTCVVFLALFVTTACCTAQQAIQQKWTVFGGYSVMRLYGYPNIYGTAASSDMFAPFGLFGGEGSVTYSPFRHVGFTADVSITSQDKPTFTQNYWQTTHQQNYLFGPEFRFAVKTAGGSQRVSLFAHQLFGVTHTTIGFRSYATPTLECYESGQTARTSCSANPFTIVSGGGMDIRVDSHISIRPAQLDYLAQQLKAASFLGGGLSSQNDSGRLGVSGFRYSVGAVVRF